MVSLISIEDLKSVKLRFREVGRMVQESVRPCVADLSSVCM